MSLASKVAIVTGASSGIGAAIAVVFAKEGAEVVLVGRNQDKLNQVTKLVEKQGKKPLAINADISGDDSAKNVIKKTLEKFGKLDILINNAGFSKSGNLLEGTLLAAYDAMVATNLRAAINLTSLAAPHLVKTKGNVINISSGGGKKVIHYDFTGYSVTKAGLEHFTRGAALELAPHGVRVNTISPGLVKTDFLINSNITTLDYTAMESTTPLRRVGEAEEIADLVLFVVSDKGRSITGADYLSDNGFILG